jgi:glycosyltransferase involved in cell wall biosynthesis
MNSYCCYFDHRYLSRGLAMIRSLKAWDASAIVWVLCLSNECHEALSKVGESAVNLLRLADLEETYPALREARSNRSLIEYYFTCTPSLVRFVLRESRDEDVVTYVDSDLYFFSNPAPLFAELGPGSISIIPHRFPPNLQHLEKFGLYNVGWMSFRNDPRGRAVAIWWQDRCNEWCYDVLDGDRFADQKYLDRIATDFEGVIVLTHRGANLAPWNLARHSLSIRDGQIVVDQKWQLIFFHFHGLRRVGNWIYIPGHFRYKAPFGHLVRARLYRPYIRHLEQVNKETSAFFLAPSVTLARYVSGETNFAQRLIASMKKPVKDALAMLGGEFLLVYARTTHRPAFASDTGRADLDGQAIPDSQSARRLRILVVHNYYGSAAPSGENSAVDAEIAMLRRAGHEVLTFTRQSDEIRDDGWRGLFHGGLTVTWNAVELLRFRKRLRELRPDIVHVHNTFPLISPAVFWVMRSVAASVMTLHNYRIYCASALLLRDGSVCTRCLDESSVRSALRYGCYRQSRIATLPLAQSIAVHRALGTWRSRVDAFIAVTEFQRDTMVAAGLPSSRMHVKPNFFSGSPAVVDWQDRRDVVLYVGRLTPEKGVEYVIRAWLEMGASAPPLRVVGEGPLREALERLAQSRGAAKIEFLGGIAPEFVVRELSVAKLLLVPSIWFEGFPLVLQEAFAVGTPSAVSNLGSLPTIVQDGSNGLVFEPRSPKAIVELIGRVWGDEALLAKLSAGARASFEAHYTEDKNHRELMQIYSLAMLERKRSMKTAMRFA